MADTEGKKIQPNRPHQTFMTETPHGTMVGMSDGLVYMIRPDGRVDNLPQPTRESYISPTEQNPYGLIIPNNLITSKIPSNKEQAELSSKDDKLQFVIERGEDGKLRVRRVRLETELEALLRKLTGSRRITDVGSLLKKEEKDK